MECAQCRALLPAEAQFCLRCGAKVRVSSLAEARSDPIREVLRVALGRQYEIQRLLGRGGMGSVYLATEAALERDVAIKVLPPDRGVTQESRDRFRREARTAARLSHPNIVPLHTFGDVDGTLYFVMGYVRGETLATRLKREGRLPVEEARRILAELSDALDYAHRLGIVHRDLKPDNVLIEQETGRATLLDFGVAKALGAGQTVTEAGSVLGTPQYMSPEQAQGRSDIDARSDLYSLGVMGYLMCAGRLPFEGATPGDVMVQHITNEPPPLKAIAPDVPPEIAAALTRCLEKDPAKRWPDARSIKAALSVGSGEDTPPALDGLGVFVVLPLLCTYLLILLGAWWVGGGDVSPPFALFPIMVLTGSLVPFVLLPARWIHLRKLGYGAAPIRAAIFAPLAYWPGWRPRRLRPVGDAWDRLPRELRHFRTATGCMILWVALVMVPGIPFTMALDSSLKRTARTARSPSPRLFGRLTTAPSALAALTVLAFAARWELFRRRRGIDPFVSNRMINIPTSRRAFWASPEVAAHLAPADSGPAGTAPSSARGLLAAISNAVASISGPARSTAGRAAEAATRVAGELSAIDTEIKGLAAGADPAEAERLVAKIEAMGPAQTTESEAKRQMRELLAKQLALLRGVASRIEALQARRSRRLDLLRSLWQQTEILALAADDPAKRNNAAASIDELCREAAGAETLAPIPGALSDLLDAPTIERSN